MSLEIGGVRTAFVAPDTDVETILQGRYGNFLSTAAPEWSFAVERRPEGLVALPDLVAKRDGAPGRFTFERHDFLASVDITRRDGRVALGAIDHIALDTFLRASYSLALLDRGAFLVHAAGLVRDGRAYVFPGRSGAGKTTVARLSPDARLLSDELSIVARDGRAWGTPFSGDLGRPGENVAAPLAGLYFLAQGDRHEATPLGRRDALAALLPTVMFFVREPDLIERVVAAADELLARVPAYRLTFRRDPGFWDVIA